MTVMRKIHIQALLHLSINRRSILDTLDYAMTRNQIMERTDIKWTTLHDNLIAMEFMGLVTRESIRGFHGRPKTFWERNTSNGYIRKMYNSI